MFNLFISGNTDAWEGEPWIIELSRCVREYTNEEVTRKYGDLRVADIAELRRFPCIFGYEWGHKKPPKFGVIKDVLKRANEVRIEYEIIPLEPFLDADGLSRLVFELDIGKFELYRTHWAVKNVDLAKELHALNIVLPDWARGVSRSVDITKHNFEVALSFPGESRGVVEPIVAELERLIGPSAYFYDNNYISQLARPSLDTLLQEIYLKRSKLVVVFLSGDYQRKEWCGIEFRAIKEIIMAKEHAKVMFVRTDDGVVDGVFKTDGYVDARRFAPDQIAHFIQERLDLINLA